MRKTEKIIMLCLALFPFAFIALFFIARIGQGAEQYDTINHAWEYIAQWSNGIQARNISEPLYQMMNYFGMTNSTYMRSFLSNIMSYEALLIMIHISYEFITFLPKMGIEIWEKKKRGVKNEK